MAFVICEPCIGAKTADCVQVCPVEAIYPEEDVAEKWKHHIQINADFYKK